LSGELENGETIQPWRIVLPLAFNNFCGAEKTEAVSSTEFLPQQRINVRALFPGVVAKAVIGESLP